MSLEDRLRRDFSAVEADVRPDPQLYTAVQGLIRRRRTFRLAFAGVGIAAAIAITAVAAPALINRRIEFEPPAPATQPATTTPTPMTSDQPSTIAGSGAPVVFVTGGQLRYVDRAQASTLLSVNFGLSDLAVRPQSSADRLDVIYRSTSGSSPEAACGRLDYMSLERDGSTWRAIPVDGVSYGTFLDFGEVCPMGPAFSSTGREIAWVTQDPADGGWNLVTAEWSADGPRHTQAVALDVGEASAIRIEDWVSAGGREQLFLRVLDQDWIPRVVQRPIVRDTNGDVALQPAPLTPVSLHLPHPPVGPDWAPEAPSRERAYVVGYASSGTQDPHAYTVEVRVTRGAVTEAMLMRQEDWSVEARGPLSGIRLPDAVLRDLTPDSMSGLWVAAADDDVIVGGINGAWRTCCDGNHWVPAEPPMTEAAFLTRQGSASASIPSTSVDVHFQTDGDQKCVANRRVTREVPTTDVAAGAVAELLEGPTALEAEQGITSPFGAATAGALHDIRVVDGQTRVDFRDFRDAVPDDQCTKYAIVDALNKTLFALPSVESTLYSFEGSTEVFQEWAGPPSPSARVMDTHKGIYSAALGRDWQMLRRISSETSCSSSHKVQSCVPYWKDQEANGEDPLGTMIELLSGGAAKDPEAPLWVYPAEAADPAPGYSGPRLGIDEQGVWRYFFLEGG